MTGMRRLMWGLPVLGALATGTILMTQRGESAPGVVVEKDGKESKPTDLKPAVSLPVSQVILFNSGVGHFTRSGEIEGDARVDLTFPEQDINDLIKSMTLIDQSKTGRVSSVTYDSRDPIDRTLRSFAINLNNNPSFSNILTQARGEAVEVTLVNTANQPGSLTGKIIGVEKQKVTTKDGTQEVEVLNMWCAEGVRAVRLNELQKLRFSNPVIENEMRRALETLSLSHDSQKKAVSLNFSGEGKRKVEVGYVIENPIWKTSYRLVLGKEQPFLQGWAVVENPTDEDWTGVTMALVSGRPISFKMDLYNPLYVGRPTVEPELFASLRPPTYDGAIAGRRSGSGPVIVNVESPKSEEPALDQLKELKDSAAKSAPEGKGLGRGERESLQRQRFAMQTAEKLREEMNLGGSVQNATTASALGDYHQYVVDQPVNLGRQKSALLPIVNKKVEGKRVSIYNPAVQAKHPLLGLKFKNTSGMPLSQGPITIYEGSVYAGDTRVLDLQPDEERLVSYAIDLGTEVSVKNGDNTSKITSVKAVKGLVYTNTLFREERVYDVSNRSATDRVLLIEQPNRKGQGFKFVGKNQPAEEAAEVYRFQLDVGSKKDISYTVVEEREAGSTIQLTNQADDQIRYLINLREASESLKKQLQEALKMKAGWDTLRQEIQNADRRIQTITADQKRLRDNLRETPKESPLFQRYLTTLENQEKEMDELQAKLKKLHADEATTRTGYDKYLASLSAE
ncbi:hypothetical protein [Zavarzinella formosa]|uniref:hypothetical protein n=1 Tax=Zavarzinella formosa TaxID=360055 RepID=UPI0002D2A57A|nr:hypothetical protein [Zavarzinella formosa]